MSLGDRLAVLVLCAAVAVFSAVAVLVLDSNGGITNQLAADAANAPDATTAQLTSAHPKGDLELPPPPAPKPAKQLAYVNYRDIPRLFPSLTEEFEAAEMAAVTETEPAPAEPSAQENPQWWSAEIRREKSQADTGPRVAAPVTESALPWRRSPVIGPQTRDKRLAERLAEISPAAKRRLAEHFTAANAQWPPDDIALVAIKDEKMLELHARAAGQPWKLIHRYPIMAASGNAGPKLRQGDMQVPEGVYGISFLNPDSRFHVSLRVNYPNAFDKEMAAKDGRTDLGGDIMIHGKNVSKGCIAIGDTAAEEVFVLAAELGLQNVKVVIAPTDFRGRSLPEPEEGQPKWLPKLYTEVASAMSQFERPPSMSLLSFFGK